MCDAWLVNGEYDPPILDAGAGSVYVDLSCGGAWRVERFDCFGAGRLVACRSGFGCMDFRSRVGSADGWIWGKDGVWRVELAGAHDLGLAGEPRRHIGTVMFQRDACRFDQRPDEPIGD